MEQKQNQAIQAIGNYAQYLYQLGDQIGRFQIGDVIQLVNLSLQAAELEQAVLMGNERADAMRAELDAEIEKLHETIRLKNTVIDEARRAIEVAGEQTALLSGDLEKANDSITKLEGERDKFVEISVGHFDRMEEVRRILEIADDVADEIVISMIEDKIETLKKARDNNSSAALFWYDAWNLVRVAMNVDTEGLDDTEKAEVVHRAAVDLATFNSRFAGTKEFVNGLIDALQLSAAETRPALLAHAKDIRHAADSHAAQENEWRRRYNEICNILGFEHIEHNDVQGEARDMKAAAERGSKQDNYQRKYNELKGSLGLMGMPHEDALKLARENQLR